MKARKLKIIEMEAGSKFIILNAPVWDGWVGTIIGFSENHIIGEMSNGFIGEWNKKQIELLD